MANVPPSPALAVDAAMALAGRTDELAALDAAWAAAASGTAGGVFLVGEPGIGKTRLAAELAARVRRRGRALRPLRRRPGSARPAVHARRSRRTSRRARPTSCVCSSAPADRISSAWSQRSRRRVPGLATPAPADPDLERLRTLGAVAELLAAATAVAPVLLVLDDLHWADELSLQLLRHVLVATQPMRLLVVGTYRDTEAAALAAARRRHDRTGAPTRGRADATSARSPSRTWRRSSPARIGRRHSPAGCGTPPRATRSSSARSSARWPTTAIRPRPSRRACATSSAGG